MKTNGIYQKESANEEYASLSFAGDISFANDYAPAQNYTRLGIDGAFSEGIQETMKAADVFMLNNEFCYTNSDSRIGGKTYTFKTAPELVGRLDEMGVDIVSIANNHAYDYGEQGFIDTMNTLKGANIPYVGGGTNLEDAKKNIVYFVINGMKIGYIAATQVEREDGKTYVDYYVYFESALINQLHIVGYQKEHYMTELESEDTLFATYKRISKAEDENIVPHHLYYGNVWNDETHLIWENPDVE